MCCYYAGKQVNVKTIDSLKLRTFTRILCLLFVYPIFFFSLISCSQPPEVSATPSGSSGYISEIGLVDASTPLRVLQKPVSVAQDGITVTVVKGVADAKHVVLLYEATGFYPDDDVDEAQVCQGTPKLQLSDGTELLVTEGTGHVWESEDGYSYRMVFPHLAPDEEAITLKIPCLISIQPGYWSQNWQIHLQFEMVDDPTIVPVIELPKQESPELSAPASDVVGEAESQTPDVPRQPDFGIELLLDQYVELETGYILMGKIAWAYPEIKGVVYQNIILRDSKGEAIPYTEISPETYPEPGEKWLPWSFQITSKQIDWPLTMTMEAGIVDVLLAEPVSFQFDPGDDPQPGQVWDLNLDFQVEGYALEVLSVEAVQQSDNLGFRFTIQGGDGVVTTRVMDMQKNIMGGGGMPQEGAVMTEVLYGDKLPNEPITVSIIGLLTMSNDPWQLSWTP
jgi:hypothetical protein